MQVGEKTASSTNCAPTCRKIFSYLVQINFKWFKNFNIILDILNLFENRMGSVLELIDTGKKHLNCPKSIYPKWDSLTVFLVISENQVSFLKFLKIRAGFIENIFPMCRLPICSVNYALCLMEAFQLHEVPPFNYCS